MNKPRTLLHECEECDYKTDRIQNWRTHLVSVQHRERESLPIKHTCKDCNKQFRDTENYLNHRLFALCEHPKCDFCDKVFSSKQGLKYHLKNSKCLKTTLKDHFKATNFEIFRKPALRAIEKDGCPTSKYLCRDWYVEKLNPSASSNEK